MSNEQTIISFLHRAVQRMRLNRLLASLGAAISLLVLLGLTVAGAHLFLWLVHLIYPVLQTKVLAAIGGITIFSRAIELARHFADSFLPLSGRTIAILFGVGALTSLALVIKAWWHPVSTAEAARIIDTRFHLHNRLGSALEFIKQERPSNFMRLAIEDAATHVRRMDLQQVVPVQVPRSIQVTSTLMAYTASIVITGFIALMLTSTVAPPVTEARPRIKLDAVEIRRAIESLRDEAARQGDEVARQLAQKIADILAQLERGELSQEEAMEKLAQLQREIQEQQQANQGVNETLQQMASAFARSPVSEPVAEQLQQQNAAGASEKLQQLAQQLANGGTPQQQNESLQDALKAASRAASNSNNQELQQLSQSLNESANQLSQGNNKAASQELSQAAQSMRQLASKQASQQRLSQASRQLENIRESVRSANGQKQNGQPQNAQNGRSSEQQGQSGQGQAGNENADGAKTDAQSNQPGQSQGRQPNDNGSDQPGQGLDAGAQPGDKNLQDPSERAEAAQKQEVEGAPGDQPPPSANEKDSDLTALTNYRSAILNANKAAQEVLTRDDIPPSYRRIVKRYFNSIKPKE